MTRDAVSGPERVPATPALFPSTDEQENTIMNAKHPLCQVGGCHRRAQRAVEIDLPSAWEATREFTTLTVAAGFCLKHGHDVARRVQALVEGRGEFYDLLHIITAAVPYERQQREKLERAEAEIESLELEVGGLCEHLRDTDAELRLARALRTLDRRRLATAGGS